MSITTSGYIFLISFIKIIPRSYPSRRQSEKDIYALGITISNNNLLLILSVNQTFIL